MLNVLIKVARGLIGVGVLIFVIIGATMGGSGFREPDKGLGYVIGGIAGFLVASVVFGLIAAILDMQKSLRFLVEADRRTTSQESTPVPFSARRDHPPLR